MEIGQLMYRVLELGLTLEYLRKKAVWTKTESTMYNIL